MLFSCIVNTLGRIIYVLCEITPTLNVRLIDAKILTYDEAALLIAQTHRSVSYLQCTTIELLDVDNL